MSDTNDIPRLIGDFAEATDAVLIADDDRLISNAPWIRRWLGYGTESL